jgi:hypothetical protein
MPSALNMRRLCIYSAHRLTVKGLKNMIVDQKLMATA